MSFVSFGGQNSGQSCFDLGGFSLAVRLAPNLPAFLGRSRDLRHPLSSGCWRRNPHCLGAFKMCMLCLFSSPSVKIWKNCYVMMLIGPYFLGCYVIGAFSMPILSLLWYVMMSFTSISVGKISIFRIAKHLVCPMARRDTLFPGPRGAHCCAEASGGSLHGESAPWKQPGWFPLDDPSMAGVN